MRFKSNIWVLLVCVFVGMIVPTAYSDECAEKVSIDDLNGVLYKPDNLHGARGPTFLVQNAYERTKKKRIVIRDVNCKIISQFGLYATDWPYGARYYQKSGGGKHSASQLYRLAKLAGSSNIFVEGTKGRQIVITDPRKRQGTIYGE